ncbi:MAG: flagellar assembly protein FliH [Janthinobacterium lividum]
MTSPAVPKKQQSAYERWEMASFGDNRPSASRAPAQRPQEVAEVASLAEQLSQHRSDAQRKGYEDGLREGYAKGLEQGREQAAPERQILRNLAERFGGEIADAETRIAADLLRLSLDIAKAMLKTALSVRPELLIPVVRDAIRHLPTLQQPAVLLLNPLDAALVAGGLGDELAAAGWRLTEDPHMERGGCQIETASNQIDATTTMRWQRIAAAFGVEADWLEQ